MRFLCKQVGFFLKLLKGDGAVKKILYTLLLFSFAAGTFCPGSWYNQHTTSAGSHPSARTPLYYVDPMHPAYKSDKPGIAPDCGMQLQPVYAGSPFTVAPSSLAGAALPPGSVRIDPARQQFFGVRIGPVEEASGSYTLRLLGR